MPYSREFIDIHLPVIAEEEQQESHHSQLGEFDLVSVLHMSAHFESHCWTHEKECQAFLQIKSLLRSSSQMSPHVLLAVVLTDLAYFLHCKTDRLFHFNAD